jgi:hypothetical protein
MDAHDRAQARREAKWRAEAVAASEAQRARKKNDHPAAHEDVCYRSNGCICDLDNQHLRGPHQADATTEPDFAELTNDPRKDA